MSDSFSGVEPRVHRSGINVPYSWWAGETASRFFIALRDEQKIFGTRCPECRKVYVPPRRTCPVCFGENPEWVEVGPEGVVVSFSVARRNFPALPQPAPVIFGLIKLDHADTALLHYLTGVAPEAVTIGMRVRAHFAPQRAAAITDLHGFRPV